jgi:chemotaxis family two-component system response regulator Rcp1
VRHFISHYRIRAGTALTDRDDSHPIPCIFVAEDNPGDVDLLRLALEEHGVNCDLLVATDGERALRYIEEVGDGSVSCPALIILDLNLPKRSGSEVLKRIRQVPTCEVIPIVILSSSDSEKDRSTAAQLGANKYLKKPSDLDSFVRIGGVLKQLVAADA